MLLLVAVSAVAGIIGTGIGGIIGVFFGNKNEKTLSGVLGFASGVMLSIVCFDLLPQAIFISKNLFFVIAALLGGVLMVLLLSYIVDKYTIYRKSSVSANNSLVTLSGAELASPSGNSLYRAGIIMFLAISLHNFPEGMAIGSGGYSNQANGIMLAILIAIHNVPEGMSIASPLVAGGMGKAKSVILCAISGVFTMFGGMAGYLLSSFSSLFTALSIAFAAGAMLYVTFGEILPEAIIVNKGRSPSSLVIVGIIVGLLLSTLLA